MLVFKDILIQGEPGKKPFRINKRVFPPFVLLHTTSYNHVATRSRRKRRKKYIWTLDLINKCLFSTDFICQKHVVIFKFIEYKSVIKKLYFSM